jgi:poly(A) polymerase
MIGINKYDDDRRDMLRRVEQIINPVYEVGGSVRDALMGREAADYDFSTPRDPDYVEQTVRMARKKPLRAGKRFGTIGLMIQGKRVDITTFRVERYQQGSRKPSVFFVDDITTDLGRRDFTINAMARREHVLIDPFNGQDDIARRMIRCVGEPVTRFTEDPLRMLRAARLAAQLDFTIEEETLHAMERAGHTILCVSRERWVAELDRLLVAEQVERGLRYLMDTGLLTFMLPEVSLQKNNTRHVPSYDHDVWTETLHVISMVPGDIDLRWAALLHNSALPFLPGDQEECRDEMIHDMLGAEMVVRIGRYLRWSRKRTEEVSSLVRNQRTEESPLRMT